MLACVDVDYRDASIAVAACVLFEAWTADGGVGEIVAVADDVAEYELGEFYKRELPCLLSVLRRVPEPLDAIVIDGHVWLDSAGSPGLGARLFEAFAQRIPVVGVAKNQFRDGSGSDEVLRGGSNSALHVSAAGLAQEVACSNVAQMAGAHRIPTILKRADRACRDHLL